VNRSRGKGGVIAGVLIGLLVGLALAVAVAVYMSRSSSQLSDKTRRAPERVGETAPGQELPDPNRHAQSVKLPQTEPPVAPEPPAQPAESAAAPAQPVVQGESTDANSPQPGATAGAAPTEAPPPPAVPGVGPSGTAALENPVDKSTYVLQVGAFKGQEDAESMKGKLALIGFEARIQSAEVNGVTFYRVRVGPYGQLDDINRARSRLAENGIEASVVRQR
jgi:cell division protein FtsN